MLGTKKIETAINDASDSVRVLGAVVVAALLVATLALAIAIGAYNR